jgi:hypothetical protein
MWPLQVNPDRQRSLGAGTRGELRTHHSRAWRSRPILCGLLGGEDIGQWGRVSRRVWTEKKRTRQLVLVLVELVPKLVGANQHTGLGVACVRRVSDRLPAPGSGPCSIVPIYCRREAVGLAADSGRRGRKEGRRKMAHVELVPVFLRSRCQCLLGSATAMLQRGQPSGQSCADCPGSL